MCVNLYYLMFSLTNLSRLLHRGGWHYPSEGGVVVMSHGRGGGGGRV